MDHGEQFERRRTVVSAQDSSRLLAPRVLPAHGGTVLGAGKFKL